MQKNIDSIFYNHSGYPDPTAGKAIRNIDKRVKPEAKTIQKKRRKKYNGA